MWFKMIESCLFDQWAPVYDNVYSENTYLVANSEAMVFTFHFVRELSKEKNDSVIKINIWKGTVLQEFFVNNISLKVPVNGSRFFDNDNNFLRFVLTGECSTLYIHNGYAIIE